MSDPVTQARTTGSAANHTLTPDLLVAIRKLTSLPESRLSTPEYGKPEYLLNWDADGNPVPSGDLTADAVTLPDVDPAWIRIDDGHILVLRWLAHFVGLRHRAVHLFLDHPDNPDATLVQVRSLAKYNAPGVFDMPIGGHVDGLDAFDETLVKELREELGLDLEEDLLDLREVGRHRIEIPDYQPDYSEYEVSQVYRATIRREAIGKIRMQAGEVGGLVLFDLQELSRWIEERPDQVGGGLVDSWPYYFAS